MNRRRPPRLPWPAWLLLGVAGSVVLRWGAPHGLPVSVPRLLLVGWGGVCAWAAWRAWCYRARRARLVARMRQLQDLQRLSWQQFEQLVGEAYRRQGFAVAETGQGGADGGIDLILTRGRATILVQCKRWNRRRVGADVVRAMYGLLVHHQAQAVKIVCCGGFTRSAQAFAEAKPIELVDGAQLLALVRQGHG